MKGLTNQRKDFYKNQLVTRFKDELQKLDSVEQRYVDEVIDALSFACTLQKARVFQDVLRTAEDFRALLKQIDFDKLCVAAQAVIAAEKRAAIRNRWWYIMGILLRSSSHKRADAMKDVDRSNRGIERKYSKEELDAVKTDINSLNENDV